MLKGTSEIPPLMHRAHSHPIHPGPDPHLSITLIHSLSLYPHIFSVQASTVLAPSSAPVASDVQPPPYCPAPHGYDEALLAADILAACIDGPLSERVHPSLLSQVSTHRTNSPALPAADAPPLTENTSTEPDAAAGKGKSKHLWLACALVPCRGGIVKEKKKEVSLMEAVIREGLKVSLLYLSA